jgi:hypothetical protein
MIRRKEKESGPRIDETLVRIGLFGFGDDRYTRVYSKNTDVLAMENNPCRFPMHGNNGKISVAV